MGIKTGELFQELERGKLYPVYLLLGEDQGGKDAFLKLLERRVFHQKEGAHLGRSVYYGSDNLVQHMVEDLRTYSIFLDRKLVVVKEFEKLKDQAALLDYISSPNDDSVLVLMTEQNRAQKKIMDAVERRGMVCIFWQMFQDESERWVIDRLRNLGVEAERDVVDYIIELSGTGRNELTNQIVTISNYLTKGEKLTLDKARDIVARLYDYTVFDLCNSLFISRTSDLLAIFRNLLDNGEALGRIFFFCNREVQRLFSAWSLTAAGYDFSKIERTLGLRKRDARRIQTLVHQVRLHHFIKLFGELHMLDHTLKSSPKELAVLTFERFIASLGTH